MTNKSVIQMLAGATLMTALTLAGTYAHAEDSQMPNESSTKLETKSPNKPTGEVDADDVISNNYLRAMSGSKSQWSLAFTLNYSGATVQTPFAENRPNIAGASGTTLKNDFDGTFSVKYAINTVDSILLGFGARYLAPFSRSGPGANPDGSAFQGQQTDAYNPSLTYQHIYKWAGAVQSVLQVGAMQWTQSDYTPAGYAQSYSIDQENMVELGNTGISVGGSIGASMNTFYWDNNQPGTQSMYQLWVSPYLEYSITEKINFRTVCNPWLFKHYRESTDRYAVMRDVSTESVGIGFSVTRDLFIYPNVQFLPDAPRADNTNVAVNATINLF